MGKPTQKSFITHSIHQGSTNCRTHPLEELDPGSTQDWGTSRELKSPGRHLACKKENIGHILSSNFGKFYSLQRLCRSKKCK